MHIELNSDHAQYVRYVELSLRYQDTILGHLYGVSDKLVYAHRGSTFAPPQHKNADHVCMLQCNLVAGADGGIFYSFIS